MKIKYIELSNIGLYKTQHIDLSWEDNSNAIIIWGNNGAGKTTLINSVKIGLLGNKATLMEYPDYCQYIKENVISSRCDKNNFSACIRIAILLKDNHDEKDYLIERKWTEHDETFEEEVSVFNKDQELSFGEKELVLKRIAELIPADLLDVIVFDGENAINILNENHMDRLIKGIIYSVFGMNVYVDLLKDLNTYLRNIKTDSSISSEEQLYYIDLENKYKNSLSKSNRLKTTLETEEKSRQGYARRLTSLLNKFSEKTGISVSDISEITENLNDIEKKKERMDADIKYINEEILPLKLIHSRIKKIIQEIEEDQPQKVFQTIDFLKQYFAFSENALNAIRNLEAAIPDEKKDVRYNVSDVEIDDLKRVNAVLVNYSKARLLGNYEEKKTIIEDIKEKLEISGKVTEESSQQMLQELESIYVSLSDVKNKITNLADELYTVNQELTENKKAYDEYKKELTSKKKDSSSYLNAILYRDAIEEFISENVNNICDELNNRVAEELGRISFRNNSIKKAEISTKNFDLKLFENNNKRIPLNLFSAGEKQVLLGIVLKEALEMSKIDTFFLFDTPVGRLDAGNRATFTNEVILKVAEQVVIFATDSDYLEDDYHLIQNQIKQELVLGRDSHDEIVVNEGSIY